MAGSAPPPGGPPPLDWDVDLEASLNAVFEDCLDLLGPYADAETANLFQAPARAPAKAPAAETANPANAFPSGGAGPSRLVPTPGLRPWQQLEPVPEHAMLNSTLDSSEWEALNLLPLADVDLSLPPPAAHAGLPALLLEPAGRAEPAAAQSPRSKLKAAKRTPPGSPRVKFR